LGAPSALAVEVSLDEADLILEGAGGDALGSAVASGGDVRDDGAQDLVIGAANTDRSYLLSGWYGTHPPAAGAVNTEALAIIQGEVGTLAGASMACAGDLNGDGTSDWLLSAPASPAGGAGSGAGYLFLGYVP
jgi:hypothetical protein